MSRVMSEQEFLERLAYGPIPVRTALAWPLPKGLLSRLTRAGKITIGYRRDFYGETVATASNDPAVWARTVVRCYILPVPEAA